MAGVVEIRNKQDAIPGVELSGLLGLLDDVGPSLVWAIQEFEAVGNDDFTGDVSTIEQQAHASPGGLIMKWNELVALAETLFDVWNILIVGSQNAESIPSLTPWPEDFRPSELVIERFDSTCWRIYARDDEILQRFERLASSVKT